MKNFRLTKKFWVAISVSALVGTVFYFYFFVYVANNERNLISFKFRSLNQTADNIKLAKKNAEKRFENSLNTLSAKVWSVYPQMGAIDKELIKYDSTEKSAEREVFPCSKRAHQSRCALHMDSVHICITEATSLSTETGIELLRLILVEYYEDRKLDAVIDLFSQSVAIKTFLKSGDIDLMRNFEEFVIIKKVEFKVSENKLLDPRKTAGIAYQTFKNELRLSTLDSLLAKGMGLSSGKVGDIVIHGNKYKLFTHLMTFDKGEDWLLCGLTKSSTYTSQIRHVDLFIGFIVSFLIIFILLCMPIIKLLVMSANERLQITNVWFTGLSIVIGAALLILLVMFCSHNLGGQRQIDINLRALSIKINNSFHSELKLITDQLKFFKKNQKFLFKKADSTSNQPFTGKLKDTGTTSKDSFKFFNYSSPDLTFLSRLSNKKFKYPYFNEAIWMDDKGDQSLFIATHKIDSFETPLNLDDRAYFRKIRYDTSTWVLPDKTPFALQSISSWRSGRNEAGISIAIRPNEVEGVEKWNLKVLAIATRLTSVIETQLPPGYGFSILDEQGLVWFHSNSKLNNRENFFDEVNEPQALKSAVLGRDTVALTFKYNGKKVRGYSMPLSGMPLSLVVFYDMNFHYQPVNFTVGQASVFTSVMFLIIGFHVLLLFVCTYRPTRLLIKRFFLSWLRPKIDDDLLTIEGINLIKPSVKYLKSIFLLSTVIILMLCLSLLVRDIWLVLCFLTLPIFVLVFHFLLYKREFILFENKKEVRNKWSCLFRNSFVLLSIALVFFINLFGFQYLSCEECFYVILVQASWLVLGWYSFDHNPEKWIIQWVDTKWLGNYRFEFPITYKISLALWLILISFVAPVYFYKSAFYTENTIWRKYLLLEAARNTQERTKKLKQIDANKIDRYKTEKYKDDVATLGNYLEATNQITRANSGNDKPQLNSAFEELLFKADPVLGGVMDEARQAIFSSTSDGQWFWNSGKTIGLNYKTFDGQRMSLTMTSPRFSYTKGDYWLMMTIIGLIIFFFIFRVLRFAVKHIFGLGWLDKDSVDALETEWKLAEKASVFIIGLPYSGKTKLINDNNLKECRINLRNPPYQFVNSETIVIEHFEYGINSHKVNEQKLKLINDIIRFNTKKIIILSAVQPAVIFDFYDSLMTDLDSEKDRNEYREYKQASRYWKNLLSGFTLYYQTLTNENSNQKLTHAQWFLNSEVNHGTYLPTLAVGMTQSVEFNYRQKEELVLQVEERASNYYLSLWNSFTNDEKFLLYDLAKDRFVNFRNLKVIRSLLQKGVLTMSDSLRIMNRSFNNFILSVVKEDEELKMEQELRKSGTWHTVQIGLIITLLGLFTFIALAHQSMLSGMNAWITAITGVVTLITRFGGVFGGKAKE